MVKQLGVPTFFMTLPSTGLKWNELVSVINKLHKLDMSEEHMENSTYHDRCHLLDSNSLLVARHFQYWVEVLFKEIVLDGLLGKTKSYLCHLCRISSSWLTTCALFSVGGQCFSFNFRQQGRVCYFF